jgi:RNA polymerase sigma-70 factor (ECF subfamily)
MMDVRRSRRSEDALSDEALLTALGVGDQQAAAAFVRRFQHVVYGLAATIVGDSALAEDVAQEAFARAWRHAEAFDPRRGSVKGWLLVITRNLAIDALRLHRPSPTDPDAVIALLGAGGGSGPGPDDRAVQSEERRVLHRALEQLTMPQRRAVVLSVFGGRSASEIAASEGIPLGTAKTRIRDGLLRLRGLVAPEARQP